MIATNMDNILPHRDPFLFVDKLEKAEKDGIIGYKKFTEKDFFFKGHFPGYPVVPGVILIETLAQCGGAGADFLDIFPKGSIFFLVSVNKAKFRRQVVPGDEVRMEIQNIRVSATAVKQKGKAFVGDELAAEAEWFCLIKKGEE